MILYSANPLFESKCQCINSVGKSFNVIPDHLTLICGFKFDKIMNFYTNTGPIVYI